MKPWSEICIQSIVSSIIQEKILCIYDMSRYGISAKLRTRILMDT
jgi:hypothetical protein